MSNQARKPKGSPASTGGEFDSKGNAGAGDLPSLGASAAQGPQDVFEEYGLEAEDVWNSGNQLRRSFAKGDGEQLWATDNADGSCDVELRTADDDDYQNAVNSNHFATAFEAATYIAVQLGGSSRPIEAPPDDFAELGLREDGSRRAGTDFRRFFDKGDGTHLVAVEHLGGACSVEVHEDDKDYWNDADSRHFTNADDAAHYIKGELSGIPNPIKPGTTTVGQTGGTAFTGGRYDSHLSPAERVKGMRRDIKALQRRGEIPADYKVSCRTDDYGTGWQAHITVHPPKGRAYATPGMHDAIVRGVNSPEGRARHAAVFELGGSATDAQIQAVFDDVQRRYDAGEELTGAQTDMLVPSKETRRAMRLCREAGEQYTSYDVDAMHDYHAQDGYIDVSMEEQEA